MRYVCIMGENKPLNIDVGNKLSSLGYRMNRIYTTDNNSNAIQVDKESFHDLIEQGKMIEIGQQCGILKPFSLKHCVSVLDLEQYNVIKKLYQDKVYGFYILSAGENIKREDDNYKLIRYSNNMDSANIVANILRTFR